MVASVVYDVRALFCEVIACLLFV